MADPTINDNPLWTCNNGNCQWVLQANIFIIRLIFNPVIHLHVAEPLKLLSNQHVLFNNLQVTHPASSQKYFLSLFVLLRISAHWNQKILDVSLNRVDALFFSSIDSFTDVAIQKDRAVLLF